MRMMHWPEPGSGGGRLMAAYRQLAGPAAEPWLVRRVPVCASTEPLLAGWLQRSAGLERPLAVVARHQRKATGQRGRVWLAPPGGLWVSAALPWEGRPAASAGLLGLSVVAAMAECLEQRGLPVRIKWPNDLLVEGRKLAGVLPRLVHRGSRLRQVRIGFGMNVANPVPPEGIALRRLLGPAHHGVERWGAELLLAFDRCMRRASDGSWCLAEIEQRLWSDRIPDPKDDRIWMIEGLAPDGALRLRHGAETCCWRRWP